METKEQIVEKWLGIIENVNEFDCFTNRKCLASNIADAILAERDKHKKTKEQLINRSAEMDVWLRKIDDHCEYEAYRGLIDINKMNLAEDIVNAIEDAVRDDRANQHDNAVMALKRVMARAETTLFRCSLLAEMKQIVKDTYGELK